MYKMGLYNDGNIYGVLWVLQNEADETTNTYEKKQDTKLTKENIAEIKAEYDKLTETDKNRIAVIKFYTYCSDTYGPDSYMSWWTGDKERLNELFENGDTTI